jgi:hypothetical protein
VLVAMSLLDQNPGKRLKLMVGDRRIHSPRSSDPA